MKVAKIPKPEEPLEIKQLETPTIVETDMNFLRRRARLVLVGLFGGALQ